MKPVTAQFFYFCQHEWTIVILLVADSAIIFMIFKRPRAMHCLLKRLPNSLFIHNFMSIEKHDICQNQVMNDITLSFE